MVKGLADTLIDRYTRNCSRLLDPFCGSGEILVAAAKKGIQVTGYDINPYATLFSGVRIGGCNRIIASHLLNDVLQCAKSHKNVFPIAWEQKHYWFTPHTLTKFERLRRVALERNLSATPEGRSVLLALAFALRLCSRADDRSPKPFVSKEARTRKYGHHVDPYNRIRLLHAELMSLYGEEKGRTLSVVTRDVVTNSPPSRDREKFSHVITSPPYLNAQDYFRNFKLELYFLDGLFSKPLPKPDHFIGTERGPLFDRITLMDIEANRRLVSQLEKLEQKSVRHAAILHRYLVDMRNAFLRIRTNLRIDGTLVVVCGDNLIGSLRVKTWEALNGILKNLGFELFDSFCDRIRVRALAPKRAGHKGLIKEEHVCAFRLVHID